MATRVICFYCRRAVIEPDLALNSHKHLDLEPEQAGQEGEERARGLQQGS